MNNLIEAIFSKKKVVVITGAGISTLSGVPDFRGKNGLYTKNKNVETILSKQYFEENPQKFYEFYKNNMVIKDIKPNIIHETLADLEHKGYISCIITQNIDNLHQKAGSCNVLDVHGNGEKFYCCDCHKDYNLDYYLNKGYICEDCNGIIRPDIVLYGEFIETYKSWVLKEKISNAEVIIVLGSSLVVSTISDEIKTYIRLMRLNKKDKNSLFIINDNETPFDYFATKYSCDLEYAFQKIKNKVNNQ